MTFADWWVSRSGRIVSPQAFRSLTAWDATTVLRGWTKRPQPVPGWVYVKGAVRLTGPDLVRDRVVVSTCHDAPFMAADQARWGPQVRAWGGMNVAGPPHPSVVAIPAGVAPDGSTDTDPSFAERAVLDGPWPLTRTGMLVCWADHTPERVALRTRLRGWAREEPDLPLPAYVQALRSSRWVVSPPGHGWDCYRTWEALLSGAWVIVRQTGLDPSVYAGLPVVVVDDWADLTPALLLEHEVAFATRTWEYDRLLLPWWARRLREVSHGRERE